MHTVQFKRYSDSSFPLHVIHNREHFDYPLHQHDICELVLILNGVGTHYTESTEYEIRRGDVFVITQDMSHGYRAVRDFEIISVLFCPEALKFPSWDLDQIPGFQTLYRLGPRVQASQRFRAHLHLSDKLLAHARHRALVLRSELEEAKPGYRACALAILTELFVYISRSVASRPKQDTQVIHKFGELLSYLEANYHTALDLDSMAKRVHMSKRSFQRQFKEATGASPIHYLLQLRLAKARQLLRSTDLSITDVAFGAGFHDGNYFTRQFGRAFGVSPLQFRKGRGSEASL